QRRDPPAAVESVEARRDHPGENLRTDVAGRGADRVLSSRGQIRDGSEPRSESVWGPVDTVDLCVGGRVAGRAGGIAAGGGGSGGGRLRAGEPADGFVGRMLVAAGSRAARGAADGVIHADRLGVARVESTDQLRQRAGDGGAAVNGAHRFWSGGQLPGGAILQELKKRKWI